MNLPNAARVLGLGGLLALLALLGPRVVFHILPPELAGESRPLAAMPCLGHGSVIADVGAGSGRPARAMARNAGPASSVYATELDSGLVAQLRERSPDNLTAIQVNATDIGLPAGCCHAINLHNVYHHITDPSSFSMQLRRAPRAAERLAVIDFAPFTFAHLHDTHSAHVHKRNGHGVAPADVIRELSAAGFLIEHVESRWGGWMYLILALICAPGECQ